MFEYRFLNNKVYNQRHTLLIRAGGDDFCTAYVQNADNKKVWVIAENYGSCDETKYVGVTGGKDYKLNLYAATEYDTMAALIRISYSQSINNTTPSVTDY